MATYRFYLSFYGTRMNGTVEADDEAQAFTIAKAKFEEAHGISPTKIKIRACAGES